MLKGDLASAPLATVLRQLADGGATGCVHLADPAGESAKVYLRGGRVYAVVAPGRPPELGARLVSSGALAPEALAEAVEAQRTELQGWRLGELLVHLGYVDQPVVEAFVDEQIRDSLDDLLPWGSGTWRFRVNERTREDVAPPVPVDALLDEICERRATWSSLVEVIGGDDAVPVLSAAGTSDAELEIDPDAWSLLCKVDGVRTVLDLARDGGLTLYEAGRVVHALVRAGLLEVARPTAGAAEPEPEPLPEPLVPSAVASRLVRALTGLGTVPAQATSSDMERPEARQLAPPLADDAVDGAVTRVSAPLAAMLGPATAGDDVFSAPLHRPVVPEPAPVADPKQVERVHRDAARRERDAEDLATAQAELEATRAADQARRTAELPEGHVAEVVDLDAARRAAAAAEAEAEAARAAGTARLSEQARLAAAEAEAARLAAEAEAEAARLAEQGRVESERQEAEAEAARRAEQEHLAAEADLLRIAEEQRVTQERIEQEQAAATELLALQEELAEAPPWSPAEDPRETAATQAAAFAELSASASLEQPAPPTAPSTPAVAVAAPLPPWDDPGDDDGTGGDVEPVRSYDTDTDTASLLRELTSLGLDDDPLPPPTTRPAPPRPAVAASQKKRKGLFGR